MRTGRIKVLLSIVAVLFMCTMFNCNAQAKMNVTVSPVKLVQNAKKHPTVYDSSVAHCMVLNEYTERMRKAGGGKLTLKKEHIDSSILYVYHLM